MIFFSKFELVLAVSAFFHSQALFSVYVFGWNKEYILDNISCSLSPEGLEKAYSDFSNNTFPTDTGIINLLHYIWGI